MFKKLINFWAKHQKLITLVFIAIMLFYPIIFKSYYLRNIAIQCLLYSILSLALNVIMGYTGIVVLGMAAFYGIGAYTLALLTTKLGFGFIPAALCAIAIAFLAGVLLALPTLRIQGNYLAIVTLGFCEIVRIVELNWVSLTNGPFGIKQ
ncbi:MAG: branched-chain amino acid ABC transporter permease, partial [Oscillospiraceae bacterium]|nr:branched-chain amino acid ABC transporter permease [Oscillospiraceae bacterium]